MSVEANVAKINAEIERIKADPSDISVPILNIQQLSRQILIETKQNAQQVTLKKQAVSQSFLALQNLKFERAHLSKEIEKALNVETIYQNVPLLSEADYLSLSKDANSGSQLMINRLNFELETRKTLESQRKELERQKKALEDIEMKQRLELEALDREIEALLNSSLPLQLRLNIQQPKNVETQELAEDSPLVDMA